MATVQRISDHNLFPSPRKCHVPRGFIPPQKHFMGAERISNTHKANYRKYLDDGNMFQIVARLGRETTLVRDR